VLVESATGDRLMLGHAGLRRQPAAGQAAGAGRQPDRLVPQRGVGPLARPAFWSSQRALRNVLEQADVVLYLVNASEAPRTRATSMPNCGCSR